MGSNLGATRLFFMLFSYPALLILTVTAMVKPGNSCVYECVVYRGCELLATPAGLLLHLAGADYQAGHLHGAEAELVWRT